MFSFRLAWAARTPFYIKRAYLLLVWAVTVICVIYQVAKLGCEKSGFTVVFAPHPVVQTYKNPLDDYLFIKDRLGKGDIVMSDPLTSWPLPALSGVKIISLYHNNPMVPDNAIRIRDVKFFYSPAATQNDRLKILNRYKATHVLLNYDRTKDNEVNRVENYHHDYPIDDDLISDMGKLGDVVCRNDTMILFRIKEVLPNNII